MNDAEQVKKILLSLISEVEKVLRKKPFFFVNEYDLSAYLYSRLLEVPELKLPFKMVRDGIEHSCYRVHLEYPRYSIEKKLKSVGKYDIAILRQENAVEVQNLRDEFIKKPVWVGFEVKLHWDVGPRKVKSALESEKNAFAKSVNKVERRPADYGVIFHLNIARKKKSAFETMEKEILDSEKQREIEDNVFIVYIESYEEKGNKPNTVIISPI